MRHLRRISPLLVAVLLLMQFAVGISASPRSGAPQSEVPWSRDAQAVPTFHLPWEKGSVWKINTGNNQGEHVGVANLYGFDASPVSSRGTDSVTVIAEGKVYDFQNSMPKTASVPGGHAGNCVIIDHGGGIYSLYAHLTQGSIPLTKGQHVSSGMVIGKMGDTGYTFGAHLHWAVLNAPGCISNMVIEHVPEILSRHGMLMPIANYNRMAGFQKRAATTKALINLVSHVRPSHF